MKTTITFIFIVLAKISFGQYQIYEQLLTPYLSDSIRSGHFYFNTPNNIQAGSLYQFYRTNAPDLNNNMQFVEQHTDADDFSAFTHYKYRQTYMSIPVEAAGCIEHYDNKGSLYLINAKIADSIKKTHVPKLSGKDAIQALMNKIDTDPKIVYAWEDESWEQQIRSDQADSNATWFPTAELIWAIDEIRDVQLIIPGSRYSLAYKISVTTISPEQTIVYYIDAQTGDILKSRSNEIDMSADVYGYGNKVLDARWHGGLVQKWELIAEDNGHNIHTKKYDSWNTWDQTDEVRKSDNNWGNTYLTETSTHFHVTNSWDYFYNTFGRLGLDGQGSKIRVYTQIGEQQAYFTADIGAGDFLRFGVSAGNQDFGMEPSIVAHEFTHGVTQYTAGLVYEFQSGALNESYSDIFGTVIQDQTLDGYTDWRIGNWIANTNISIRSLINPGQYGKHWDGTYDSNGFPNFILGQPFTYQGPYWCACPYDVDKGGVHINSGVQNRWFYALTQGAPANPPFPGIGMTKAARIAYYALTNILMSSAQYTDSKEATITAAIILYGECSAEHKATVNAWNFVDMPASYNCTLGVDEFDKEDIELYPNPTSSIITIKVPVNLNQPMTIFDLNGKLVKQVDSNQLSFQIDLSSLDKGVYLAHFLIEGQDLVKRIVIQ